MCSALRASGVAAEAHWGSTLYHLQDLPFSLETMPANYGGFRERVQELAVRPSLAEPQEFKGLPVANRPDPGDIPSLAQLGLRTGAPAAGVEAMVQGLQDPLEGQLVGGEGQALARLRRYVAETAKAAGANRLKAQGMMASSPAGGGSTATSFSTKISPWLAAGCLSPRRMYEDLRARGARAESDRKTPMNGLVFELLWRDFFRFITCKYSDTRVRVEGGTPIATARSPQVA